IALFFVNGHYHRKGIGRQLFQACMNENTSDKITVHSSLYAADVYRKLGFTDTGSCTIENGMQYIPMEWTRR
ncbi:MAG: GNAT family N-acetyltransferase, partial [Eubacteriales bacterium]